MELGDAYRDFISLLLSSSIGFLNFIYRIFHSWEFFFFFFWICLVVLCSPFPWRVLCLYKYTAYNYFILYNSIIHEPYLSVFAGFICVSLYPFFFTVSLIFLETWLWGLGWNEVLPEKICIYFCQLLGNCWEVLPCGNQFTFSSQHVVLYYRSSSNSNHKLK